MATNVRAFPMPNGHMTISSSRGGHRIGSVRFRAQIFKPDQPTDET